MMIQDRILISEFCDDIRYEMGNKYSLMGCYTRELIVEKFPITLPKFCVLSTAITPIERPFKKLVFKAYLNDSMLHVNEIPSDELQDGQIKIYQHADENSKRFSIRTQIIFVPFSVEEESIFTVKIETEEGITNGSKLKLRLRTDEDVPLNV